MRNLRHVVLIVAVAAAIAVTGLLVAPAGRVAAQSPCGDTVTVQRGDTLSRIARICGTTVSSLLAANPTITNPNAIYPGQLLRTRQVATPPPPPAVVIYTVQPGDWLASIAARHGLSWRTLLAANPQITTPNRLLPGQRIIIPATEVLPELGPPSPPTVGVIYIVQRGDWLASIARRNGVSLSSLLAANPQIVTPSRIVPGQRILIPR